MQSTAHGILPASPFFGRVGGLARVAILVVKTLKKRKSETVAYGRSLRGTLSTYTQGNDG